MAIHSQDQPSRDGGVVHPSDEQLEGATADGGPLPDEEPLNAEALASPVDGAASLEAELAAQRDRNLRLRAELENVRSRTSRELAESLRYAALPIARDLLPVLDNIDRAMEAAQKAGETGPLVEGIRMVRQQLVSVLNQHHAYEIDALGKPFDPQFHAAILHQPSNEAPADHVTMVTQAGYRMHDRVVRPSQVIVSSGPPT
ncbi:MAG: nucleotide exchange factor GrpE [Planctomycetota bacterium]|nr:MAG: nucleotide exchange factor GrpE [Planctomycetota bacterium]